MSPVNKIFSDQRSETVKPRKGRPAHEPGLLLASADAVFAGADAPASITMEAIATAAGVGKATVFRTFGNRDGLLEALWTLKLSPMLEAVQHGPPPLGPTSEPEERAIAFLHGVLHFKLANRHLIKAREIGPNFLQSERYRWMHTLLSDSLQRAAPEAPAPRCRHAAHILLAGLHIDVLDASLAGGLTTEGLQDALEDHAGTILASLRRMT